MQRLSVCTLRRQKAPSGLTESSRGENDESQSQVEEGTKDVWMNVWWTAVKWLWTLCLCHVALFPLSVSVFNELLISLFYMLMWDLTHWGLNVKFVACKIQSYLKISSNEQVQPETFYKHLRKTQILTFCCHLWLPILQAFFFFLWTFISLSCLFSVWKKKWS